MVLLAVDARSHLFAEKPVLQPLLTYWNVLLPITHRCPRQVESSPLGCGRRTEMVGPRWTKLAQLQSKLKNTKAFQALSQIKDAANKNTVTSKMFDLVAQKDICISCDACMTAFVVDACVAGSGVSLAG